MATKTKQQCDYQNTPKGTARCGVCRHFRAPGGCTIVKGRVVAHGWCKFFARK